MELDVGFLGVFIAFLLISTWLLLLQHVLVESAPAPDRVVAGGSATWASPRMLMGLAAAASIATFLFSTALFFVIPRVGLAALPFRSKIGSLVTGFSDRVELGAYGQIQNDSSIAMRVHVAELFAHREGKQHATQRIDRQGGKFRRVLRRVQ